MSEELASCAASSARQSQLGIPNLPVAKSENLVSFTASSSAADTQNLHRWKWHKPPGFTSTCSAKASSEPRPEHMLRIARNEQHDCSDFARLRRNRKHVWHRQR